MDPGTLIRAVLSLTELELRIRWLGDRLFQRTPRTVAALLNALCEEGDRGRHGAREALLPTCLLMVRERQHPWLEELRVEAQRSQLLGLQRLIPRMPPSASVERNSEPPRPIPDYGFGREVTLGERRSLARRHDRALLERLLGDPHPLVIRQLLANPRLTEADLLRLVARRPANIETLNEIANTTCLSRDRVRMAVLLNPGVPLDFSGPLLAVCTRTELKEVLRGADTPGLLRAIALEYLERRPPIGQSETGNVVEH